MRVALDAMGGDFGPEPNVTGAIAALQANPELFVDLVGEPAELDGWITKSGYSGERIQVVAADGFVRMDEKPTDALRKKPNCSIALCWQKMAGKEVDAVVSAGHTGAVVAAGLRTRLFLKGIKRPGIAVALPTAKGRSVLMDVGANPSARPEHLLQYGVMASIYAREILGIERPTIGLMNIGSEDGKGTELVQKTHQGLMNSPMRERYVGNIEGRGLYQGDADVLICEGFVGNVVLKVSEGIAEMMLHSVAQEVLGQLQTERETAMSVFENLSRQYQHSEAGGAPLLGIDGICIICHGSSDSRAIGNALKVATTFRNRGINSRISAEIADSNLT